MMDVPQAELSAACKSEHMGTLKESPSWVCKDPIESNYRTLFLKENLPSMTFGPCCSPDMDNS